jgi:hypothetical protein
MEASSPAHRSFYLFRYVKLAGQATATSQPPWRRGIAQGGRAIAVGGASSISFPDASHAKALQVELVWQAMKA